jgi:hypothetical protein
MLIFNSHQTSLLLWGIVAHLLSDWFLQNHWQSSGKTDLRNAAAWIHSGIHAAVSFLVFPGLAAVLLGLAHVVIDTRKPLVLWGKLVRQSTPEQAGPAYIPFAMGRDQAAHVLCIAFAAAACGG